MVPEALVEWKMMTEKYHCTPEEFDRQPFDIIELHRDFMIIESNRDKMEALREEQKRELNRNR